MTDIIPVSRPPDPDRPYVTGKPAVPQFGTAHQIGLALMIIWTLMAIRMNDSGMFISAVVVWGAYALWRMWRA